MFPPVGCVQVFQQVLHLNSGCDEFNTCAAHLRQKLFSVPVNECDVAQVHHRVRSRRLLAGILPARAQFVDPRPGQAPAQTPTVANSRVRKRNPQHKHFAFAHGNACGIPTLRGSIWLILGVAGYGLGKCRCHGSGGLPEIRQLRFATPGQPIMTAAAFQAAGRRYGESTRAASRALLV